MPTESELSLQSEFAVEHLRSDIVSGAWSPGAKLKMRELLPRYDIGASPMREALARLAAEGFVEQRAQRGVRVPELTFEELQDLSATRQIVESEAIRLAALHGNHAWRDNVVASFSLYERDIREHGKRAVDWRTTEPRHHLFHKAVVSGCPFPTLRGICDSIHQRLTRYRLQLNAYRFGPDEVIGEHRILMEAVLSGDGHRAQAAAQSHFGLSLSVLETELKSRTLPENAKIDKSAPLRSNPLS